MSGFKSKLIAAILLSLTSSACTEIVPGLLIHSAKDDRAGSQYRIVERDGRLESIPEASSASGTNGRPDPAYRLIPVDGNVVVQNAQEISTYADATAQALPGILPSFVPPEYRVGPSDILYVTVWDHPELTTPNPSQGQVGDGAQGKLFLPNGIVVDAGGNVFFPYVGSLHVAGTACSELRTLFTEKLGRVIANPQVDIKVAAYRAARVLITGEVKTPGTINLDDTPKGILDGIAGAGGLTATASRRQVILIRNGNSYRVNLAGLLSGSHLAPNPGLYAGDVVHVPSQTVDQIFMLGQVSKSQPVVVQQNSISLIEALTTVGGVDRVNAKGSGILVFRLPTETAVSPQTPERPPATIYMFDMSRPEGMLLASEFQLMPRDVVYVDSTLLAKYNSIISSLLPTVNSLFYAAEINQLTRTNN